MRRAKGGSLAERSRPLIVRMPVALDVIYCGSHIRARGGDDIDVKCYMVGLVNSRCCGVIDRWLGVGWALTDVLAAA